MSSIDNRIVNMKFDNKDFQKNANETVGVLDDLKEALNLEGAADGLAEVENTASRFSLSGIVDGIKNAVTNFPILGAIGLSAINKLTTAAMGFGASLIQNVIGPLKDGGWRRAMNLEQAQFQLEGLKIAWEDIKPAILGAVQGTAYGLDEAAKAASQLAASQVPMEDMLTSLRGISGVAAMTGQGYDMVASIFTKVAGQGRLMGDDLNRLGNYGINAAATLADHFGITEAELRKLVSAGKVGFAEFALAMDNAFGEHATKANETYTGALANMNAALARIGAESATIKMERQRRMFNALAPAIDDVAAALQPLWRLMNERSEKAARSFEGLIESVRNMFSGDIKTGMIWFMAGVRNIFAFLDKLGRAAKDAWSKIFPSSGESSKFFGNLGKGFYMLTTYLSKADWVATLFGKAVEGIAIGLKFLIGIAQTVGVYLSQAFGFASEKVQQLWVAIQPVIQEIKNFISGIDFGSGGGGFPTLDNLRDSLIQLKDWALIPINKVFSYLTPAFAAFAQAGADGTNRIKAFFGAFDGLGTEISEAWADFNFMDSAFVRFFQKVGAGFATLWQKIKPTLSKLGDFLGDFISGIGDSLVNLTKGDLLSAINTGIFAAIAVQIVGFIRNIKDATGNFSTVMENLSGLGDSIKGVGDSITAFLTSATENKDLPGDLVKLALAVGLLAGSFWLIAQIPTDKLGAAGIAMGALMAAVGGALFGLSKMSTPKDSANITMLSTSMVLISASMLLLAAALSKIAEIDPERLWGAVGAIGAVAGVMAGLALAMGLASKMMNPGSLFAAAAAMIIMAGSLYVVAGAVAIFGYMDPEVLAQGMENVALALGGLVLAALLMGQNGGSMLLGAIGMMAMVTALTMLTVPILALGYLNPEVLSQGMMALAMALGGLILAMLLIGDKGPQMALGAVGLMAMAMALQMMVPSILALGLMDMNVLAQGLLAVGIAIGILVIAANAMKTALPGAAALVVMAGAVIVLSIAIQQLGNMTDDTLIRGLVGAAVALGLLVAAGYAATPAAVGLGALALAALGLGGGMMLLSMGLAIFGPAATLAATGIVALGNAAAEASPHVLALIGVGAGLVLLGVGITAVAIGATLLGVALMAMGVGITMLAAAAIPGTEAIKFMVDELTEISLLDMAKLGVVSVSLTALGVALLALGVGALAAGVGLLAFGLGWGSTSMAIVVTANPVIGALERLAAAVPPAMLALVESTGKAAAEVPRSLKEINTAFRNMARDIIASLATASSGMQAAGRGMGLSLIEGIAATAPMVATAGQLYVTVLIRTLQSGVSQVANVAKAIVIAFTASLRSGSPLVTQAGTALVSAFIKAVTNAGGTVSSAGRNLGIFAATAAVAGARSQSDRMFAAGYAIGLNLTSGMRSGINAGAASVRAAAYNVASSAASSARRALQIASPSRVMMAVGKWFDLGMASGITDNAHVINSAAADVGLSSIEHLKDAINEIGASVFDELDIDPTIRPVVDLSDVQDKASSISKLLEPALVGSGAARAQSVAGGTFGSPETAAAQSITNVEFKQTNTSPKALPSTEIYRRTKNGLSVLKDSLENK